MTALPPPDPATQLTAVAPPARRRGVPRSRLSPGYRWVLAVGWVVLLVAMGTLGRATDVIGDPVWWLPWSLLLALLPVAVLTVSLVDLPGPLLLSALATGELAAIAVRDLVDGRSHLSGWELGLAVSGALLTLACRAGRLPAGTPAR
jgi:hypothetical protein